MESKKILTLCIIHKNGKVLLGMKKRGFGQGRWNGFGGKIHEGETIETAAKRETLEESGVNVLSMEKMGMIEFEFKGNPKILEVHIFRAGDFSGNPVETEEMRPQWFDSDKIPFEKMWQDDKYWFPLFFAGKKFKGKFLFDSEDNILEYKLEEVLYL
jgi:8-oxo-dGTP diphosphatase / 2-hydroxy-dATP diphosphatase